MSESGRGLDRRTVLTAIGAGGTLAGAAVPGLVLAQARGAEAASGRGGGAGAAARASGIRRRWRRRRSRRCRTRSCSISREVWATPELSLVEDEVERDPHPRARGGGLPRSPAAAPPGCRPPSSPNGARARAGR